MQNQNSIFYIYLAIQIGITLFANEQGEEGGAQSDQQAVVPPSMALFTGKVLEHNALVNEASGRSFDTREAHSAIYDAESTALLFCDIVNRWRQLEMFERERIGAAQDAD